MRVLLLAAGRRVRDGDRVLAIVRGTAAKPGWPRREHRGAPSAQGSDAVSARWLQRASKRRRWGMVEASTAPHPRWRSGRIRELGGVWNPRVRCALRRKQIGHLQSASGPLGLMKTILALRACGVVPRNSVPRRPPDRGFETTLELFKARSEYILAGQHRQHGRAAGFRMECRVPTCMPSLSKRAAGQDPAGFGTPELTLSRWAGVSFLAKAGFGEQLSSRLPGWRIVRPERQRGQSSGMRDPLHCSAAVHTDPSGRL